MMTTELTRDDIELNKYTLTQAVQAELERLHAEGQLDSGIRTEPRCYVCCELESKDLVNKLIAVGLTNREIAETVSAINERRKAAGDKRIIEARNVWWHRREHFNVDKPAEAACRAIVERYAEQMGIDHINGVGTAVTPMAVMHTVMLKGYFEVATGDQKVTVKEMLDSAAKLQAINDREASGRKMADIRYMMDRIISAAQTFVPADQHENFLAMVEGRTPMGQLADKTREVTEAATKEFVPNMSVDEQDAL